MSDVTVVTAPNDVAPATSPSEAEIPAAQSETIAAETAETVTDAAVEIARIEADRDVTMAAISAETEAARSSDADERIAECQRQILTLTETMEAQLSLIQQRLTELGEMQSPPPNLPSAAEDGQKESPAETEVAVVEVPPPADPERKKRGHRWI